MNILPITNFEKWFNCTIDIAIELPYQEYFFLSSNEEIIHGRVVDSQKEGILLKWDDNYFGLPAGDINETMGNFKAKRVYVIKLPSKPK